MAKTVKEKAKEWGCSESTVRSYCSSGIIPPAFREGKLKKWMIPDNWDKPPMARHSLCYLLDTIYQLNNGVAYDAIKWGYKSDDVKKGYDYLIGAAFMSTIDTNHLESALISASVTPRGKVLIEKENTESKGKTSFKAHVTATANVGIASVEVGAEVSNG